MAVDPLGEVVGIATFEGGLYLNCLERKDCIGIFFENLCNGFYLTAGLCCGELLNGLADVDFLAFLCLESVDGVIVSLGSCCGFLFLSCCG